MANLEEFGRVDMAGTSEWGGEREPLPEGEYHVAIVGVEVPTSRAGNPYLKIDFAVLDGPCARRHVWESFSIWSATSDIPRQKFKSLRTALGLNPNTVGTTEELRNLECRISVKIRERNDGYGPENRISGYKPSIARGYAARPAAAPAATPSPAPAPSAGGGSRLPWEKEQWN